VLACCQKASAPGAAGRVVVSEASSDNTSGLVWNFENILHFYVLFFL
jgi:hypothetical protein